MCYKPIRNKNHMFCQRKVYLMSFPFQKVTLSKYHHLSLQALLRIEFNALTLLGGLEWLLLANIQFIPAITSSLGQLKKIKMPGVLRLETIIATIILVAFRTMLVSWNSKDGGYEQFLCSNTSFSNPKQPVFLVLSLSGQYLGLKLLLKELNLPM